ncbi:polysaccharide deacetylase family protein, partial [Planococcus sp. SIMBA_160]
MAAFDFWEFDENERFKEIIEDGLEAFEKVYGYRSDHFNPPGGREHPVIHKALKENGVKYIDTPLLKQEHQGNG